MKKVVLVIMLIALLSYLSIVATLYIFQRDLLYFPTENQHDEFEHITLTNQDETIDIIVLNKGKTNGLIYFGGNGESIVVSAPEFLSNLPNDTVYLINYRGYGGSSGKPSEQGIYSDALAIYDFVKDAHVNISVAGRSLGSGVATYLAAKRPINKVVLITPYDSVLELAKSRFSVFPVEHILKDKYDSLSRAKDINSQILVIAAERDNVIPMPHTLRLIEAFGHDQVRLKIIDNAGHNSLSENQDYYQMQSDFLSM